MFKEKKNADKIDRCRLKGKRNKRPELNRTRNTQNKTKKTFINKLNRILRCTCFIICNYKIYILGYH